MTEEKKIGTLIGGLKADELFTFAASAAIPLLFMMYGSNKQNPYQRVPYTDAPYHWTQAYRIQPQEGFLSSLLNAFLFPGTRKYAPPIFLQYDWEQAILQNNLRDMVIESQALRKTAGLHPLGFQALAHIIRLITGKSLAEAKSTIYSLSSFSPLLWGMFVRPAINSVFGQPPILQDRETWEILSRYFSGMSYSPYTEEITTGVPFRLTTELTKRLHGLAYRDKYGTNLLRRFPYFGVADLGDILRMSLDYGMRLPYTAGNEINVDRLVEKTRSMAKVIEAGMAIYHTMDKEKVLQNILELGRTSVSIENIPVLEQLLYRLNTIAKMTNISVDMIQKLSSIMSQVYEHIGIPAQYGAKITMGGILFTKYLTQGIPGLYKPQFTSEELQKSGGARQIRINLEQIGTSVLASSASKEMGLWIQSQIKKGVPPEEAVRRALIKMSRSERLEAKTVAKLEEEIRNEAVKKGFKPGTIAFNEYVEETKEERMAKGVELIAKYISQHPMETRPYISKAFLLSIIKKDLGMTLEQFQKLSYEDQKKMVSGAITNYHPNIASNKADADSIAATLIKSANFPAELGKKIDIQVMLEEEQQRLTQYTRQADNYKLRMAKIFNKLDLNKSIPEVIRELIRQGSTIFGQQYNIMGKNIKTMSDKEIEDFFMGILRPYPGRTLKEKLAAFKRYYERTFSSKTPGGEYRRKVYQFIAGGESFVGYEKIIDKIIENILADKTPKLSEEEERILKALDLKKLRKKVATEGLTLRTIISGIQEQDIFSHDPVRARDQASQYINLINFIMRLFKESKNYKVINETVKRYREISRYLNKISPIEALKHRLYGVETSEEETPEEEKDYFREALLFYAKHPEKIFEKRKLDIGDIRYKKYPIIETYANALFMSGQIQSVWDYPNQLKLYEKIRKKIKAGKINLEDIQDWSDILELLIEEGGVDIKRLKTDIKYKKHIAQKVVNIGAQLVKEFGTTKKIPIEEFQKITQHPYKFTDETLEKLYLDFISTPNPKIRFHGVFERIAPGLGKGQITEKGLDRIRYFLDYLRSKDLKAYTEAVHLLSQNKKITEAATVKIDELSNKEFYKYIPALFYFKGAPQEFKLTKYPASLVKYSAKLLSGLKKGEDWRLLLEQLPSEAKEEISKYTAGKSIQEITQELSNIRKEIQKQVDSIFNKLLSGIKKEEIKEHYKKYSDNLKKVIEVIISNNETLQKIFKQESVSIESLLDAIGLNKHYIDTLIRLQQKNPEALTTEQKQMLDRVRIILNIARYSGTKVTFKDLQERTAYSNFIEPIRKKGYNELRGLIPVLRSAIQKQKISFTTAQEILQKFSPADIETMLKSKTIEGLINYASQKGYISKQKLLQGDTEEITKTARLIKTLQTFTTQEYNPWGQKFIVRTALPQKQSEKDIKPLYEYMQKQGLTAIEQLEKSQAEPKGLVLQILNSEEFQKLARNKTATMKDLIDLLHEKTYISKRLYYQNEPHTVEKVLYFLRMLNTIPARRRPTFVSNIQYQLEQYREVFQTREQQEQQLKGAYQSYAKAPIISYIDIPALRKEERKITSLPQEEEEKYKKGLLSYSESYIEAINRGKFLEYYPDKDKAAILHRFISKAKNLQEIYKEAQRLGVISLAKLKTGDIQEYAKLGALHGLIQTKAPEKIKKELQEQDQAGIFFIPSISEGGEFPFIFSPYRPSMMLNAIIEERKWTAETTLKQAKNISPETRQELQFQVDFFKALQEGKLNKILTQKDINLSGLIRELRNAKLINPNLLFKSPRERRKLSFTIGFLRKYGLLSQNLEDQLFELETLYNTDLFTKKISEEQYRKIEEELLRKPPQSIEDVRERIQKIVPELSEEELNQATRFFYISSLPPKRLEAVAEAHPVDKETVETYLKILKYLYSKPETRSLLERRSILEKYQISSGKKYISIKELADLYGKSPQYVLGIIPQTAIKKVPIQNLVLYYTTLRNRLAQLKNQQTKISIEELSKKIRTKPEILKGTLKVEETSPEEAIKKIQHTITLLSRLPKTVPISSLKKIIDLPDQIFRKIATFTPIESIELEDIRNLFETIKEGVRKQYEEGVNILDIRRLSEETGIASKILLRIFGRKPQKTDKAYHLIRRALGQLDKYSKEKEIRELRGGRLIEKVSEKMKIPSKALKQAVLKQKSERIKGTQEIQIETILKNLENAIKKTLPTQAQLEKYQLFTYIRTLANEPQTHPSQLKTVVSKAVQTLDLAEKGIFEYARKTPNEIIEPERLHVPLEDLVLQKILTEKEQKFYKGAVKEHAESYAELLENLNKKLKKEYLDARSQAFTVLNFYHIPHEKITEEDLELEKYPKKIQKGVELLRDIVKAIKKKKPKLEITTETLKHALYEEEYLPEDIKQLKNIRDKIQKYIRQERIIKTTKFYEEVIQQIPKLPPDVKRAIIDILKKQIKEKAGDITLEDIGAELEKAKDRAKRLTVKEIPTIETIKGKVKHPAQMIISWETIEAIAEKEQMPIPKNPIEKAKLLVAIMRKLATDTTVPQPIRKEYQSILKKLQKQAEGMEEGLTTETSSAKEKYIKIGNIEKIKYEDIYRIQQTEAMRQKYKLPSDFRKVMEEMKIEDLEAQQKAKEETLHTIALTMETPLIQLLSPRNRAWWNKILFTKKSTEKLTQEELDLAEMLTRYLENRKQYYLIKGNLRLTPEEKKEKLKKIQQQAEEMIQQFSEKYHIPLASPESFLAYTIEKVKKIAHKYGTERILYGGLRGRVQELERVEALGQTSTAIGTLSEINIGEKTFKKINETLKGVVDRFYKSISEKLDIKNDVKDMNQNIRSILESIKDYIDNAQNNNELKFIKKLLESLNNTLDRLNKSLDILDTKIQVK